MTPAIPARPRNIGRPGAAFRNVNGVGIATSRVFGAESSRPASSLCTLRTHQSPGEWQHSLPACVLGFDRAGLAPAGFHQGVSPSHFRFLLFHAFPSAITTSALSAHFFAHLPGSFFSLTRNLFSATKVRARIVRWNRLSSTSQEWDCTGLDRRRAICSQNMGRPPPGDNRSK